MTVGEQFDGMYNSHTSHSSDNNNSNELYLQKLFLRIKITSQGNYVTLIILCHEHQNKQKAK